MMVNIKKIDSLNKLSPLKQAYFEQTTAPLDGMWHFGFVPMATHFGVYHQQQLVGFFCLNQEGFSLQFYLTPEYQQLADQLFSQILNNQNPDIGYIKGAFVSTAEPHYLALCLDNSMNVQVNSIMYQHNPNIKVDQQPSIDMTVASVEQLPKFVEFAMTNIGAPEQWLTGYYTNLIAPNELFGDWHNEQLIAAGECRLFDLHQSQFSDLGMIVNQADRGKGIAKQILTYLVKHTSSQGLTAICSTECSNFAALKAISAIGFVGLNRIVQVDFKQRELS